MEVQLICHQLLKLSMIPSWYENKFASLETNLERVNFVYDDMKKHNLFPKIIRDIKSDPEAIRHRERGNKVFQRGKYLVALEDYTRSVATAETDKVRALAFANRSHCLYKLKMYKECLVDINRAFANNYSGVNRDKLILRKRDSEKLQKPEKSCYEQIPAIPDSERNPLIQSARNCVKIEENDEFGRCIVATRDIEIGEVISVEKPFACVLRKDFFVHCHECLEPCYNLIPCSNCTQALYCGKECLKRAQNTYHKYECPLLLTISKLGINWILIALRIVILAKEDYNQLNTCRFDKSEYYRSDRYKEIHALTTGTERAFDIQFFTKTVSSAIVFELIKTGTAFLEQTTEDIFKELLLFHVQVASTNGLNIYEFIPASDGVCYEGNDFAGGIYAFSSLYNHSCSRNLHRAYHGSTLVVRSINTIKKGQQCFINYGSHYDVQPFQVRRQHLLNSFSFLCKCRACEKDWQPHFVNFAQAMNLPPTSKDAVLIHKKMAVADVEFVKNFLPRFVARLKRCEDKEPKGEALTLKRMIEHCYETLGTKRRI